MLESEAWWLAILCALVPGGIIAVRSLFRRAGRRYKLRFLISPGFLAAAVSTFSILSVLWSYSTDTLSGFLLKSIMYSFLAFASGAFAFYHNIGLSSVRFGAVFTIMQFLFSFTIIFSVMAIW